MDLKGFGFIVCAVALVFGLFVYSGWDQTHAAAEQTELAIQLERQPEVVQTTAEVGMTVLSKVITGTVVSLIVAAIIMVWQQLKIRELKNGGWERFWERRKVIQPRQPNARKPKLEDLLMMYLMKDRNERK